VTTCLMGIILPLLVHTVYEVMNMQGKQESTESLERQARQVETFNDHWHNGTFMGPNTERYESGKPENQNQAHNSRREGMGPNTKRKPGLSREHFRVSAKRHPDNCARCRFLLLYK